MFFTVLFMRPCSKLFCELYTPTTLRTAESSTFYENTRKEEQVECVNVVPRRNYFENTEFPLNKTKKSVKNLSKERRGPLLVAV